MTRVIKNFVNGQQVDAADGQTTDVVNPPPVRPTPPPRCRARPTSTPPWVRPPRPSRSGGTPRPASAAWPVPDRGRRRGPRRGPDRLESENTGKPIGLTESEEIPPMVDQIRFFAGAARVLEGLMRVNT